jgi:hypothetical protein
MVNEDHVRVAMTARGIVVAPKPAAVPVGAAVNGAPGADDDRSFFARLFNRRSAR